MLFKTHLVFAFLFGLIFSSVFNVENVYLFILLVLFASGLPDIDHPGSKYGRKLGPLSFMINLVAGHRGIFHSLLFALLFGAFGWWLSKPIGLGIFIGYLSHLIGDGLSKEGINLLYPFAKLEIKGFFKVGGFAEYLLLFSFLAISLYMIIY